MNLDETLKKYVEEIFSAPDFTLYHYTNFGKEIINSKHLKMSPHEELNKKNNRELKVGPELTREKLNQSSLFRLLPLFNEYIKRGIKVYVASFCEEENYSHAIQNYGEDCIGVNPVFAKQFCNTNSALLGNVKYDINEQKKIISEMFGLYESSTENPQEKICSLFLWLSVVFPLLKEKVDHKDNECRIITAECRDRDDPQKLVGKSCIKEIKFELDNIFISRMRS